MNNLLVFVFRYSLWNEVNIFFFLLMMFQGLVFKFPQVPKHLHTWLIEGQIAGLHTQRYCLSNSGWAHAIFYSFLGSHLKSFWSERDEVNKAWRFLAVSPNPFSLSSKNYPNFPLGIRIFTIEPILF